MRKNHDGASIYSSDLVEIFDDTSYDDGNFDQKDTGDDASSIPSACPYNEQGDDFDNGDLHTSDDFCDIGALSE